MSYIPDGADIDLPEVRVSNAMRLYTELSLGSSIWPHSHEEFR